MILKVHLYCVFWCLLRFQNANQTRRWEKCELYRTAAQRPLKQEQGVENLNYSWSVRRRKKKKGEVVGVAVVVIADPVDDEGCEMIL